MNRRITIFMLLITLFFTYVPIAGFQSPTPGLQISATESVSEILEVIPDYGNDEVKVRLSTPEKDTAILTVAAYDDNGIMADISTERVTTGEISVPIPLDSDMIKVMLWDSMKPMQPLCSAFPFYPKKTDKAAVSLVDADRTMDTIRYLSRDIGSRVGGTKNEEDAVDWLITAFDRIGLLTEKHQFNINLNGNPRITNTGSITIHNAEDFYGIGAFTQSGSFGTRTGGPYMKFHGDVWETTAASNGLITGINDSVTGEVVYIDGISAGSGSAWEASTRNKLKDAAGKIALIGVTPTAAIANIAADENAIVLMGHSGMGGRGNFGQAINPKVTAGTSIPVLGLALCQGEWLKAMLQEDRVTVDVQTVSHNTTYSWNAIGVKLAENNPDTAPILIVTSHIDTVAGAPGANDNTSGTAVMLEAAQALSLLDTPDVELRFISFGAEEIGLIGSERYVARMSAEERSRVMGVFNMDMTASSDEEFATYWTMSTVDGLPNIVTDSFIAAANRLGYGGYIELAQFSSSDHVPFHNAGMPSALGIWMGREQEGPITPDNYTIERFYHTPQDTIEENISEERVKMCIEIATATLYDMALNYERSAMVPTSIRIPSKYPDINELNGSWYDTDSN